ncbi:MAG: hypothetical protein HQ526_03185 [Actinobacteria bacterium]|nr:hypothetical protein [Actinomycetota bacterium]
MTERELILHIGPAKTATTTIQAALVQYQDELLAEGVYVPLAVGDAPGQHLPILKEFVDEKTFAESFEFSKDTLSAAAVVADFERSGKERIVISAEGFVGDNAREPVLSLIRLIAPDRLRVVFALRPPMAWLLSNYSQEVLFGLSPYSRYDMMQYARYHALVLAAVGESIKVWSDGPWGTEVSSIAMGSPELPPVETQFSRACGFQTVFADSGVHNAGSDACILHLMRCLNELEVVPHGNLQSAAVERESLISILKRTGLPAHTCSCSVTVTTDEAAEIESVVNPAVEQLLDLAAAPARDARALLERPATLPQCIAEPSPESFRLLSRSLALAFGEQLTTTHTVEAKRHELRAQRRKLNRRIKELTARQNKKSPKSGTLMGWGRRARRKLSSK